ncbi:hypothetical protein B6S44_27535 [Bosea sp. Tri-44]|nr:hypothetical protein B6S44_27535 [Bosea sp. Tri-44]
MPAHAVFASTRYMDPKVRGFVDLCRDALRDGADNRIKRGDRAPLARVAVHRPGFTLRQPTPRIRRRL